MADRSIVLRLRAEVSQAVQALGQVEKATDRTGQAAERAAQASERASKRQADAAGRVRVAEEQLAQVRQSKGASSAQLTAAEERLAKAKRDEKAATDALVTAEKNHKKALDDVAAASRGANGGLSGLVRSAKENEQAWTTAGTALTVFGGAITAVGVAAAKTGIQYNTLQQTTRAALTVMLGGAEKANAQMDRLDAFARNSPFAKQTFIQAQQQMIGFGVATDKVLPTLQAIQDAVAAFGGSNEQISSVVDILARLQSQGRLSGEALERLGYYGIDAATIIGEQMGKSGAEIKEMASKPGGIPVEQIWDPLVDGLNEKFGGAAANVKETFDGAVDRVKAAWRDLSASLAEPLVGQGGGGLAVEGLNRLADAMREFESMPEPIRNTAVALGGLTGAVSLTAGTALLALPRLIEMKQAYDTITASSTVASKAVRGFGLVTKVAGGAAAAFAGLYAVAQVYKATTSQPMVSGNEDIRQSLLRMTKDAKIGADALNNMFKAQDGGELVKGVKDLDSAIYELVNRSGVDKFNDWINDMGGDAVNEFLGTTDKVKDQFKAIDESITALATSGNYQLAQEQFSLIAERFVDAGGSAQDAADLMPQYVDSLKLAATELEVTLTDQELLNWALGETPKKIKEAAAEAEGSAAGYGVMSEAVKEAAEQLQEARTASGEAAASFLDFSAGLDEEKFSLRGWLEELEKQTEALTKWAENMSTLRERGLEQGLIEELEKLGPAGAQAVKQLADASDAEIQRANEAFLGGREAIMAYVEEAGLVPDINLRASDRELREQLSDARDELRRLEGMEATPTVSAAITALEEKIKEAEGKLKEIDGRRATIYLDLVTDSRVQNMPENLLNPDRKKGGSYSPYVSKDPIRQYQQNQRNRQGPLFRATGGRVVGPGTGKSDEVPAWLSNGEHVLTADEVRAAGGHDAIYRIRAALLSGEMPAFATGGAVGAARARLESARRELRALSSSGPKTAEDRKRDRAQARVDAAQDALDRAEAEAQRRERVAELQRDARTDFRRGSVRDQVTGSLSGAYSVVDRLYGLGDNEDLTRVQRDRAKRDAAKFESDLRRLYGQAERLDEKLKDAKDKASELEGIQSSVASGLMRDRSVDLGDYSRFEAGQWVSDSGVAGATRRMDSKLVAAKAFAGKMKRLAKAGIPGEILREIAGMGVEAGSQAADAFLSASKEEQSAYVSAYEDYGSVANEIGQYVTEGFYDGGVQAAQGLVRGLESQQAQVEAQILKIARAMEQSLKAALGIKSPSRVMYDIGEWAAVGLANALADGAGAVAAASEGLASAVVPDITVPAPTTTSASPASGGSSAPAGSTDAVDTTEATWDEIALITATRLAEMQLNVATAYTAMDSTTRTSLTQREQDERTIQGIMAATNLSTLQQMLRDQQSQHEQMKATNAAGFTSMRDVSRALMGELRSNTAASLSGMNSDAAERIGWLRTTSESGFDSIRAHGVQAFRELRAGMNAQMGEAQPNLTSAMNRLTDVLNRWRGKVNTAFGDVGVKLPEVQKLATGGEVHGPGTATSDSIPARLSAGEFVVNASAAREFLPLLHAINGPGGAGYKNGVPGFARGGMVWPSLWNAVKGKFGSKVRLHSAYRPGARTTSGNQSYHARGMAIDITPDMDIFNWIHSTYGKNSAELIYSPAGGRQLKNGKPYMYTGAVRRMHFGHIHWAMRQLVEGGAGGFGGYSEKLLKLAGVKPGDDLPGAFGKAARIMGERYSREAAQAITDNAFTSSLAGGVTSAAIPSLVEKAREYGRQAEEWQDMDIDMGPHSGGAGVERWRPLVERALSIMGQPSSLVETVLRRMNQESGGNPRAINNWDVNARRGTPSKGLMQVIDPTYRAYRHPEYDKGVYDPLSNILASMRYALSRYGSLSKAYNRRGGYSNGTLSSDEGWSWVGELGPELVNLPRGSRVLPNPEAAKYQSINARPSNNLAGIDVDGLAAAIGREFAKYPRIEQHIDSTGLTEERLAARSVQRIVQDQALYAGVIR